RTGRARATAWPCLASEAKRVRFAPERRRREWVRSCSRHCSLEVSSVTHNLDGDDVDLASLTAGLSSEQLESLVGCDGMCDAERSFGLLDHDPRLERGQELMVLLFERSDRLPVALAAA